MFCESVYHDISNQKYKIERIQDKILEWGSKNMREYPWRNTTDPYKIMIAEIMLHRTKADQVKKVYEKFIEKYPDFKFISDAGLERIRSELLPLGLHWRVDLLYEMAGEIVQQYNGILPTDKNKLMKLSGTGPYISSTILCFGYNKPEPILDTNTVRIIGRVFGLEINDSSRRNKHYEKLMKQLVDCKDPRVFSFSMIDFAALVCRSGNKPKCEKCPITGLCEYHGVGELNER